MCSVEGCATPAISKGLCNRHYKSTRKAAGITPKRRGTLEERFWEKVDRGGGPDACWPWTAGKVGEYGVIGVNGVSRRAHRVAFLLTHGYYPENGCHTCDNPPCCNPDHIFDGTKKDNAVDMMLKGRCNPQTGELNVNARLSAEQAATIRSLYANGQHTQTELARMFGVGQTQVSRIVRGERWSHS